MSNKKAGPQKRDYWEEFRKCAGPSEQGFLREAHRIAKEGLAEMAKKGELKPGVYSVEIGPSKESNGHVEVTLHKDGSVTSKIKHGSVFFRPAWYETLKDYPEKGMQSELPVKFISELED